jgi:hydroxyisourate hydrolase
VGDTTTDPHPLVRVMPQVDGGRGDNLHDITSIRILRRRSSRPSQDYTRRFPDDFEPAREIGRTREQRYDDAKGPDRAAGGVLVILDATGAQLRELLRSCLAVPRWIQDVESCAPYPSGEALLEQAGRAATPLSRAEIDQALAGHPRIGHAPEGAGLAAGFSRREQEAPDADDAVLASAVAEGNAVYEARFGRVFLIRAAGRTRAEIRAEQLRRSALDEEAEIEIVGRELREIALLRLRSLLAEGGAAVVADADARPAAAGPTAVRSHITTHVLDCARGVPADGLGVTLEQWTAGDDPGWRVIGRGSTSADGRIDTLGPAALSAGRYRVSFDTGPYLTARHGAAFYPEIVVSIDLADPAEHYHVPLLLSPFAYSTYRGS